MLLDCSRTLLERCAEGAHTADDIKSICGKMKGWEVKRESRRWRVKVGWNDYFCFFYRDWSSKPWLVLPPLAQFAISFDEEWSSKLSTFVDTSRSVCYFFNEGWSSKPWLYWHLNSLDRLPVEIVVFASICQPQLLRTVFHKHLGAWTALNHCFYKHLAAWLA